MKVLAFRLLNAYTKVNRKNIFIFKINNFFFQHLTTFGFSLRLKETSKSYMFEKSPTVDMILGENFVVYRTHVSVSILYCLSFKFEAVIHYIQPGDFRHNVDRIVQFSHRFREKTARGLSRGRSANMRTRFLRSVPRAKVSARFLSATIQSLREGQQRGERRGWRRTRGDTTMGT